MVKEFDMIKLNYTILPVCYIINEIIITEISLSNNLSSKYSKHGYSKHIYNRIEAYSSVIFIPHDFI